MKSIQLSVIISLLTILYSTAIPFTDVNFSDLKPNEGILLTGEHSGDLFGTAVETIGDINNDGIDDVYYWSFCRLFKSRSGICAIWQNRYN